MPNFNTTITGEINNLILQGSEYPIVMANIYDELIQLQKKSRFVQFLRMSGFLDGFSTDIGLQPTTDTEQTLTAIKQIATTSYIKTTPITTLSTTPFYYNGMYKKYTIPKFRATTHVSSETLEDLLQVQTFNDVGGAMSFYQRRRLNLLTSHVGLIVRWEDSIMANIFSGGQNFTVETYDGTGTPNITTSAYGLDTNITGSIGNTISLQTIIDYESASIDNRLSDAGEPIAWVVGSKVFTLLFNEYRKGTNYNQYGTHVGFDDVKEANMHNTKPMSFMVGEHSYIYRTSADLEKFTFYIDNTTTPTTASRYGAIVVTKRAVGGQFNLPTRFQTNVETMPDPLRRGYLSEEMGIYNVEQIKSSAATGMDLTYMDFKSSKVFTYCPDQFNLGGLFQFALSSPGTTDGGLPYDYTGTIVADATSALAKYNASIGSRIQSGQQFMARDGGGMDMDIELGDRGLRMQ